MGGLPNVLPATSRWTTWMPLKKWNGLERHRSAHQTGMKVTEMVPKAHSGEIEGPLYHR
jgi:hypothetical protein